MKINKSTLWHVGLYVAFIILFWFLGPTEKMDKATAFFGVVALSLAFEFIYQGIVKNIIEKDTKVPESK